MGGPHLRGLGLLRRERLDLVPQRLRLLLDGREAAAQDAVLALQPLRRFEVSRRLRLEPAPNRCQAFPGVGM